MNTISSDPKKVKAAMDKEQLNWRTFVRHDTIKAQWGDSPTPAYYVLDAKGMIRHKWIGNPGDQAMDAALEKLMKELER